MLSFACDLLLPAQALVIEVIGGIHALAAERDEAPLATLRAQGRLAHPRCFTKAFWNVKKRNSLD